MKRYFMKKNIFAAMFLFMLFTYSALNFKYALHNISLTFNQKFGQTKDVKELVTYVESSINETLLGKMYFIEAYGYIQKLLGKHEIDNFKFVKYKNGFLDYASFYRDPDPLIGEYAKRVKRLQEAVKKDGSKVLFINPPGKYIHGVSELTVGSPINDGNSRQDEFLLALLNNGVESLDLRMPMIESELSYEKMFFKTDHHWTVPAAFEAFSIIVEDMENRYGIELDPEGFYRNLENYNIKTYPQSMLGTQGRDTGITYSGLDDFTFIWPDFETDLEWNAFNEMGEEYFRTGEFEKSLLLTERLNQTNIYKGSLYNTYINGVSNWDKIINKKNKEGPKILIIRDSYFSPVASFLSLVCSEVHMIWPLAANNQIDVEEYVKENSFDYVFVELYPSNINDESFNFFRKK